MTHDKSSQIIMDHHKSASILTRLRDIMTYMGIASQASQHILRLVSYRNLSKASTGYWYSIVSDTHRLQISVEYLLTCYSYGYPEWLQTFQWVCQNVGHTKKWCLIVQAAVGMKLRGWNASNWQIQQNYFYEFWMGSQCHRFVPMVSSTYGHLFYL